MVLSAQRVLVQITIFLRTLSASPVILCLIVWNVQSAQSAQNALTIDFLREREPASLVNLLLLLVLSAVQKGMYALSVQLQAFTFQKLINFVKAAQHLVTAWNVRQKASA